MFTLNEAAYMPFYTFGMNDINKFGEIKQKIFEGERLDLKKLSQYFEIQINYFVRADGKTSKHSIIPFKLCEKQDFLNLNMSQSYVNSKMKSYADPLSSNRMNALCPDMERFNKL